MHTSTTLSIIGALNDTKEQVELSLAELFVIDRTHYLKMLEHEITLQELSRRWFMFVKMVQENTSNPFIKATAEMELNRMLELATSIEMQEFTAMETIVKITMN